VINNDVQLVSCRDIAYGFMSMGVERKVNIVPLGVNVEEFPYLERNFTKKPFIFLMFASGQWMNYRKNYMAVHKAFLHAFGANNPDVLLYLKGKNFN